MAASSSSNRHPVDLPFLLARSTHADRLRQTLTKYFGISTLSKLQRDALQVVGRGSSIVVFAGTGAGKSLVSELAVAQCVLCRVLVAIVVVPFVALVYEQAGRLRTMLGEGSTVHAVAGAAAQPRVRKGDVIICTIERASIVLNRLIAKGRLDQVGIVVVDELHMAGDPKRGPRLEAMLSKLRSLEKKRAMQTPSVNIGAIDKQASDLLAAGKRGIRIESSASDSDEAEGLASLAAQMEMDEGGDYGTEDPHSPAIQIVGLSATMGNRQEVADWLGAVLVPPADAPPIPRPVALHEHVVFAGDGLQSIKAPQPGTSAHPRGAPARRGGCKGVSKPPVGWGLDVLRLVEGPAPRLGATSSSSSSKTTFVGTTRERARRLVPSRRLADRIGRNASLPMEVQGVLEALDKDGWMRVALAELLENRRVVVFCSNPSQTTSAARTFGRVLSALEKQVSEDSASAAATSAGTAAGDRGEAGPGSKRPHSSIQDTPTGVPSSESGGTQDTSAYSSASQAIRGLAKSGAASSFGTAAEDPMDAAVQWARYRRYHHAAAGSALAEVLSRSAQPVPPERQRLLELGVGVHNGELGEDYRDAIERCFREGLVRCLIATSTVSAGVNLPADTVIVRTPGMPSSGGLRPISTERYLQMVGRAGRQGHSQEGRSYLIPFRGGRCPVGREACDRAQRSWSNGQAVVARESAAGRAAEGRWRGDWAQVCSLVDRLFVNRHMLPVRSHLDGPSTEERSSAMRAHSVASPLAGGSSPGRVADSRVANGFASHLLELIAGGFVATPEDCTCFMESTLLHRQRPEDASKCLAEALAYLLSLEFVLVVPMPAESSSGSDSGTGSSPKEYSRTVAPSSSELSPPVPYDDGARADQTKGQARMEGGEVAPQSSPEFVLAATQLGYACSSSGLSPPATIRVAEELFECQRVGIPPASDVFCLYLLLGQCELVLRNASRDDVVKAAQRFCTHARRKAEVALLECRARREAVSVPAIAGAEHLDAIREQDGRFSVGMEFMASFLVDGALRVLGGTAPGGKSPVSPSAAVGKGTTELSAKVAEGSRADAASAGAPAHGPGPVLATIEHAALHAADRPFLPDTTFAPRSTYQARLNQVRYFLAEIVLELTRGTDPARLCARWGLPSGVLSKLWHDLSASTRQVLQVAKALHMHLLHAVLSRLSGRLSKGAAGPQLTLLRQLPSLRRHFAAQLTKEGLNDAEAVLARPVEGLAEALRRALPYTQAAVGNEDTGVVAGVSGDGAGSSTAGSGTTAVAGQAASVSGASGATGRPGVSVSEQAAAGMWERLVRLACTLQAEARLFIDRRRGLMEALPGAVVGRGDLNTEPAAAYGGGAAEGYTRGGETSIKTALRRLDESRAQWAARHRLGDTSYKAMAGTDDIGLVPGRYMRALVRGSVGEGAYGGRYRSRAGLDASKIAAAAGLRRLAQPSSSLSIEGGRLTGLRRVIGAERRQPSMEGHGKVDVLPSKSAYVSAASAETGLPGASARTTAAVGDPTKAVKLPLSGRAAAVSFSASGLARAGDIGLAGPVGVAQEGRKTGSSGVVSARDRPTGNTDVQAGPVAGGSIGVEPSSLDSSELLALLED